MRTAILADDPRERDGWPTPRMGRHWLTTGDAARMLQVTRQGVRWMVADERLRCERTNTGQRLFQESDVLRLAAVRATARIQRRDARLMAIRVRMLRASLEPRQLALRLRYDLPHDTRGAKGHLTMVK